VTPDVTPPTIVPPSNVTTEATGNGGAVVTYPPADTGDATDVSYDHPSGDFFPVGTTTVTRLVGIRNLGSEVATPFVREDVAEAARPAL
jgi:hypothetical protein